MNKDKMYSRMIDNLPWSIKPSNYDVFKAGLVEIMKRDGISNSHGDTFEQVTNRVGTIFNENKIILSKEQTKTYAAVAMALAWHNCETSGDIEFDLQFSDIKVALVLRAITASMCRCK